MKRTASASLALSGAQLLAKMIDFFLILVLARLLTPEDFALIAIAMIFVQITEAILQVPVTQVLVRTPRVTRNMLYTGFAVSCIRALIVVGIILILTPISVWLFKEPRLYVLMPVLALAPAFRSLMNPKMALFARRLNYYPEAGIGILSRVITAAIALPFAIATESYWALVLMTVISPALSSLMSYLYLPFLPRLSLKSWGVFANMVGWATVAQTFGALNWQVKVFVMAQFATRTTTGNYSVASNLNGMVRQSLLEPLVRPFISTFSLLEKDGALQGGYLIASRALFMTAGPIFVVLAVLANPIILFLFGPEWTDAPILLCVLAISSILIIAVRPASSVAYARDRTFYIALTNGINFATLSVLLWCGFAWYGLTGFLIGQVIGAVIQMMTASWMVKRLVALKYLEQLEVLVVPAIAMSCMALCLYYAAPLIHYGNQWTLFFSIGAVTVSGVVTYLAVILLAWTLLGRPEGLEKTIVKAVF
ncbi:MAG: oligosaccharide flippase family protein [Pseudomonadota bacterium]